MNRSFIPAWGKGSMALTNMHSDWISIALSGLANTFIHYMDPFQGVIS